MQRDMISGDMRFIGTKKETLYQMSKKSKQLFNACKSSETELGIKEIKVDKQGYSITLKAEIGANATASSKKICKCSIFNTIEKSYWKNSNSSI